MADYWRDSLEPFTDTRRIVAAVNACKGISTEWLEGCAKTGSLLNWSEDSRRLVDAEQLLLDIYEVGILNMRHAEQIRAFLKATEGDAASETEGIAHG